MAWLKNNNELNEQQKAFYSIPMKLNKLKDAQYNEAYQAQTPTWKWIVSKIPVVGSIYRSVSSSGYQKQLSELEKTYRSIANPDSSETMHLLANTSKVEQLAAITQRVFQLNKKIQIAKSALGKDHSQVLQARIDGLRKTISLEWKKTIDKTHTMAIEIDAVTSRKLGLHDKHSKDYNKWHTVRQQFGRLFHKKLQVSDQNIGPSTSLATLSLADNKVAKQFNWQTARDKVNAVLDNRHAFNEETIKRYEYYQQQIESGQQPALPKYYHATTLDNLLRILDDRGITPSQGMRPGVWVSTSPEVAGDNTMLRKDDPNTKLNVCGLIFSSAIEQHELAAHGRTAMANFLINRNKTDAHAERLWVAFKAKLPVISNNSLHPSVTGLFFTDEGAYSNFLAKLLSKPALAQLVPPLKAAGKIVIGTENLLKEQKILQGETLYPAHWQPNNWHR